ncbi:carboxylating nicotinate-nucleotide diphosphorylase [Corynebacterium falsenii]|uniref:carboxylating nicotinate-nucleotide diphosphorylase n=1 Tax=Corynebacterium falsenii TaxID=108486 RepID=UPI001CCDC951|nr:carboxylating nicotinate-nucleotide diphosphorylase [Corynebacterium falsenii]UBI06847.1 carboxylating nicotinate-nucleotide diphosphorylase [Corynebacterium falsenii]
MRDALRPLIRAGLAEDFLFGPDAATLATIDPSSRSEAVLRSRERGVVAALAAVPLTFEELPHALPAGSHASHAAPTAQAAHASSAHPSSAHPSGVSVEVLVEDGDTVEPGQDLVRIAGLTASILEAERTMLNIVSHASGIATATRRWVDAVEGTHARIRDTRKTLPGLRELQKYAVCCGGGVNHRMGLGDAAMIKDNHIAGVGDVAEAFGRLTTRFPDLPREIEVDTLEQLRELLPLRPELILLDNFSPEQTRQAVELTHAASPETKLESSGGLSLEVARDYAEAGVDYLAVGALTHSVRALDVGLDFVV